MRKVNPCIAEANSCIRRGQDHLRSRHLVAGIFDSPREMHDVSLLFASDDAAQVWLNGKPAWTVAASAA